MNESRLKTAFGQKPSFGLRLSALATDLNKIFKACLKKYNNEFAS